jgi:hypothetical protein
MLVLRKFWWGTASEEVLFLYFCCSYLLTQETEKLHQWQKRTPASLRSLFSGWDKHDIAISTLYSRSHFCSYRWAVAFFQTTFVYPSSICSFQTELFVVDFWINLKFSVQFNRAYSLASLIICPEQCLVVSQHITSWMPVRCYGFSCKYIILCANPHRNAKVSLPSTCPSLLPLLR